MNLRSPALFAALSLLFVAAGSAADPIQPATDAPRPFPPELSVKQFHVPPGFRVELIASEPLIREPSGACWDEHGRLFVCELHGYNYEGHLDVHELNKTGVLDHQVRRIPANKQAQTEALKETYGTVKLLTDTDGDGRMDHVTVFADRLPPCYGICAARGGIIVACAPDIVYLADRDGDGVAEVREVLFTGFQTGALERGINAPQWGLDNWIYFGRGHGGGLIQGPHLREPVRLGGADFRIKPDGSAIEAITGSTHTFGFAFTADGERFTATTSVPGLHVTPLPWRYLARNPDAASPRTEQEAGGDRHVYPAAPPHPWRSKRAEDPGFFKFYKDRYGAGDSEPNGWFTSACSPLVYQDVAWPAEYRGQYLVCEPAQNLIHRAMIERDGPALRLRRAPGEEKGEFLTSSDQWFHPMNLVPAPDGSVGIVDFYREIIEDYSAIPRYLQQQYSLTNGIAHGRLWRLTHEWAPIAPSSDLSRLGAEALVGEVASASLWRRQTARRLLVEHDQRSMIPLLSKLVQSGTEPAAVLNALYTLDGFGQVTPSDALAAMKHPDPGVRRHGLRFYETWLSQNPAPLEPVLSLAQDQDHAVLLQLALTLGQCQEAIALTTLARLAREHGDVKWMAEAIVSSLHGRGGEMLAILLTDGTDLNRAKPLLEPIGAAVAARRDEAEMTRVLSLLAGLAKTEWQTPCLRGFRSGLKTGRTVSLPGTAREALTRLLSAASPEVRSAAAAILAALHLEDPAERAALLAQATRDVSDLKLSAEMRLAAVTQLASVDDTSTVATLLTAWTGNTPKVRAAILEAVLARHDRWPALLNALEQGAIPTGALTAFQRVTLLDNDRADGRARAAKLLASAGGASDETFKRFSAALQAPRDAQHGEQVFRENCATCHQAHGLGAAVGPDLGAEFQRAEEAILKDILAPNDTISAGFSTYAIETSAGQTHSGILVSESATSVTLRQPTGLEQVILRKDIVKLASLPVSLMPEALAQTLKPKDTADVITWLRGAGGEGRAGPGRIMLFDDEAGFIAQLTEGDGRATLEREGAFAGKACLAVTPLQRHAARIEGWNFRIAEKPAAQEFRYLRLAWKTPAGQGVMLELAASGQWPDARDPRRRYFSGRNTTAWQAHEISPDAPREWRVVTLDLWKDCGAFTLTGLAPTALGGTALFDRIELLRDVAGIEQTRP